MKWYKSLTRQVGHPVVAAGLVLALHACGTSEPRPLPEAMHGQWYYLGASGGIDGGHKGDSASGYIVVGPDNIIATHRDDDLLVSRTAFTAAPAKTIFAAEELWMIHPQRGEALVAILSDDGLTLTLTPNAYDAIGRTYVRSRAAGGATRGPAITESVP